MAKKSNFIFFPEKILPFFKDQKVSFYGKNQQSPMIGFEEIGENFGPKWPFLGPKSQKQFFSPKSETDTF